MNSWEHPGNHVTATADLPAPSGCDALSIDPSLNVAPSTSQADTPSGYSVTTTLPQNNDPDELGTPALRRVQVTLPEGVALAPPAADGLALCSDAQLGATSDGPGDVPRRREDRKGLDQQPAAAESADGLAVLRRADGEQLRSGSS